MASIKRVGKDNFRVPIWEVVYRPVPGGKQVRRRIHAHTRADVERQIMLDGRNPVSDLRWSVGVSIYLKAKKAENRNPEAMGHVERAARVFIELMGDLPIEATTAALMKDFMAKVVDYPVIHAKTKKELRKSGPKVANHHRKELLTVARYLRAHTEKITTIPFEHVPVLPVKREKRQPIPKNLVGKYLDALNPEVRRPILLVLYYGLRSTSICNIRPADAVKGYLHAVDKGEVERDIPIDPLLETIIEEASAYRNGFDRPDDRLFVNKAGHAWNRMSLLRAAQRSWEAADLPKRKIHEFRHTLGTLASKQFTQRMVQAAMGHRSEKSAAVYFHPDEEMAAEVRQRIITELSQNSAPNGSGTLQRVSARTNPDGTISCPCCNANISIIKE
ncbi:MAG: site-specific integrase [Planctomycetaceae bacterium]|nr:site-specific integrase [Planctomycetaceae bacterium]